MYPLPTLSAKISRSSYRQSTESIFLCLNLLRVMNIYKLQTALFMFRSRWALLPASCYKYFDIKLAHVYGMRKSHYFKVQICRTNVRVSDISVRGPKFWNSLSVEVQQCPTVEMFKRAVKSFLLGQ